MSTELTSLLVSAGKITQEQADKAMALAKEKKEKFSTVLVQMGAVTSEDELASFVGKHLKIGALRLSDIELNPEVVKLIPLDIARKFKVIAVSRLNKTLLVAISDPNNIYVLDAVKFITGCNVQPAIAPEKAIDKAIETFYTDSGGLSEIVKGLEESDLEVVSNEEAPNESDLL
jgi:type IV pilus assembly protein PilB